MSQDQITAEIKHSYENGLILENISCSNSGAIKKCSYKNYPINNISVILELCTFVQKR